MSIWQVKCLGGQPSHTISVHSIHLLWLLLESHDGFEQFVFSYVVLCREFARHCDRKRFSPKRKSSYLILVPFFLTFFYFYFLVFFLIHYMGWADTYSGKDFHQYLNSKGCTFPFFRFLHLIYTHVNFWCSPFQL